MVKDMSASNQSPRDRILATAMNLFYRQGFSATGINQIIHEADVARASFYDHFPSKMDLLASYAAEMTRKEIAEIRADVFVRTSARARFFGPLDLLAPWLEASEYRGCPFQNIMAEAPNDDARVREAVRQHRESLRAFFQELALDAKNADPDFSHLCPETTALTYLLIFEGAIALCVAYREASPIQQARTILIQALKIATQKK